MSQMNIDSQIYAGSVQNADSADHSGSVQNAGKQLFSGHEVSMSQAAPRFSAGQKLGITLCILTPVIGWITGAILAAAGVFKKKVTQQVQMANANQSKKAEEEKEAALNEEKQKQIKEIKRNLIFFAGKLSHPSPKEKMYQSIQKDYYKQLRKLGVEDLTPFQKFSKEDLESYKSTIYDKFLLNCFAKLKDDNAQALKNQVREFLNLLDEDGKTEFRYTLKKDVQLLRSVFGDFSQENKDRIKDILHYHYKTAPRDRERKLAQKLFAEFNDRVKLMSDVTEKLAGNDREAMLQVLHTIENNSNLQINAFSED